MVKEMFIKAARWRWLRRMPKFLYNMSSILAPILFPLGSRFKVPMWLSRRTRTNSNTLCLPTDLARHFTNYDNKYLRQSER